MLKNKDNKRFAYFIVPILLLIISYFFLLGRKPTNADFKVFFLGLILFCLQFLFLEVIPVLLNKRNNGNFGKNFIRVVGVLTLIILVMLLIVSVVDEMLNWQIGFSLLIGQFSRNFIRKAVNNEGVGEW